MRTPTGNRCDDNERAPRVRRSLEVRAESVLLAPRRRRRTACERAQETAEDAAVRIGSDREMYAVEMDHQAEQVQVERPEDEIQDRAVPRPGRPGSPAGSWPDLHDPGSRNCATPC